MKTMKKPNHLIIALFCWAVILVPITAYSDPPSTVAKVDLQKYLGEWYEIASYPQWFQKGCTATKANYSFREDGVLRVLNTCKLDDPKTGKDKIAEGVAWVVDPQTNAKLKVQFPLSAWFRADFLAGNYWIIMLEDDYRYAVVSDPTKEYLWILARQSTMQKDLLDSVLKSLQGMGYDLGKLQYTSH